MNLSYAILLAIVIGLINMENYGYGYWLIGRPVFAGPLLGLIMGDVQTGLAVGASVELMYLGVLPVGASIPPNAQMAGLLGTAFAILSGGKPELGITLAVPIGVLAQLLVMLAWNANIFLTHKADKYIEEGNIRKVEKTHLMGLLFFFLQGFIPAFLAIYFGADLVNNLVEKLPVWLIEGLETSAKILPAIGMAMLLKMMDTKKYWPFFLIGFVLAVYLELDILAIALIGLGIASAIFIMTSDKEKITNGSEEHLATEEDGLIKERIITKGDLNQVLKRSFFTMTSINYERFENLGFCYSMIPALKKIYTDEEDLKEALKRHNEFFNCHPYPINAILGVSIAMEEQKALSEKRGNEGTITGESISATKTALMGPLAGIGDSIFKATFMTLFAAMGSALALEGNLFGPILFIVPNILLNLFTRYYGLHSGYKLGLNLITKINESDILDKFVEAATIVGLLVVGAMVVGFVGVETALEGTIGGAEIVLQDMLDKILPGLLPLLITMWYYSILKKENKNNIYILIVLSFAIGIIGKALGILA